MNSETSANTAATTAPDHTTDPAHPAPPAAAPEKRLTRSRDDKYLGGVCGGLAEYVGLDANLVRLLVVVGTVLGLGTLVVAYVAAWLLLPEG